MPKYTEAFFNITHKPVTIMQIRNEYNLDHTVYERRYKGHIFCPYCKAVPLTVVHTNGLLYYRGHPHEEHGEGCMYTLKEIVIKDVEKIGGNIENSLRGRVLGCAQEFFQLYRFQFRHCSFLFSLYSTRTFWQTKKEAPWWSLLLLFVRRFRISLIKGNT